MNLDKHRRWSEQRWSIIVAGFAAAYVSGVLYGVIVKSQGDWNRGAAWERSVIRGFHLDLPPFVDSTLVALSWFGTNVSLIPIVIGLAIWLWFRHKRADLAMWLLIVQLGSYALNPALKNTFDRARPDLYPGRGWYGWTAYPSGHLIASISILLTMAALLKVERGWKWPYLLFGGFCVISAYSRIYLGVHWPSDVLGGVIVGMVWFWACYRSFRPATNVTVSGLPRSRPGA